MQGVSLNSYNYTSMQEAYEHGRAAGLVAGRIEGRQEASIELRRWAVELLAIHIGNGAEVVSHAKELVAYVEGKSE